MKVPDNCYDCDDYNGWDNSCDHKKMMNKFPDQRLRYVNEEGEGIREDCPIKLEMK